MNSMLCLYFEVVQLIGFSFCCPAKKVNPGGTTTTKGIFDDTIVQVDYL
jgi:hypothetical protein